jgi:hypothetical protein
VELLGYNQLDGVPMVDVYVLDENKQVNFLCEN